MLKSHIYFIFFVVLLTGCIGQKKVVSTELPIQAECFSTLVDKHFTPTDIEFKELDEKYQDEIDRRKHFLSLALEMEEDLQRLVQMKMDEEPEEDIKRLRDQLIRVVDLAEMEVSAIASGLICEEENSTQLATYLDRKVGNQERKLTVAAITIGAGMATARGVTNLGGWQSPAVEGVILAGALVEVYIAVKILLLTRKMEVEHPVNIIEMVIEKDNSAGIFSPAVWFYLNETSEVMEKPLRDQMIERWETYTQYADKDFDLFMGEKGTYNAEQLHTRSDLLENITAQVNIMKQDIMHMMRFLHGF
ncbi:hypothetical protein [Litoribacter populi]|uniref:hypothetical protein n=1 Tax=Litoribacter populi TaxID=2598460 RepID=UPI00117EEAA0|nr:hypothetical protein [Litoribacter populi]